MVYMYMEEGEYLHVYTQSQTIQNYMFLIDTGMKAMNSGCHKSSYEHRLSHWQELPENSIFLYNDFKGQNI